MSSGGDGGSRVSIPADLRKTIQNIREITGKQHSDEDIFTVFNDCFYDPHETAQKLLYLDTFHEVRSKRKKKKESSLPIAQLRGRTGRRNYFSSYPSPRDAGDGRNAAFKRESGANSAMGLKSAPPAPNKARNNAAPGAIKVSNGPKILPNGVGNHKVEDDSAKPVAVYQPFCKSTTSSEVSVEPEKTKASPVPVLSSSSVPAHASVSVAQNNVQDSLNVTSSGLLKPVVNNQSPELQSSFNNEDPSLVVASNHKSGSVQVVGREAATNMGKGKTQSLPESGAGERPHVTFPVHFKVGKSLENGLMFGSFDSKFAMEASCNNGYIENDHLKVQSSHGTECDAGESSPPIDDTSGDASSRQSVSTFAQDKDHEGSELAPREKLAPHSDHNVLSVEQPNGDEPKQETVSNTETYQLNSVQNIPHNGFGFLHSSATGHSVSTEALETQTTNPNIPAISNPTSTDQNSVVASQQAIHLFGQQYPPSFFPYGPYFPPFYLPQPHIHQFLCPNGLPQQSYLPPAAAAAAAAAAPGVKLPFFQLKPGTNAGNPPAATIPSAYGSYGSSPVPLNHIPSATSLNSVHKEDISISQMKENVYTTGPLSESAAAWMAAQGNNLSNLQVNPMYNLALQAQHLPFSPLQAGHGGFAGIYQPMQTMVSAASAANQTLQPSHTTAVMPETVGPPPIAYQQPQVAQSNWSSNY